MNQLTTPQEVTALLSATTAAAALGAAVETGLLWDLAENPLSAPEVSRRLAIPERRCQYWLQCLCELGILTDAPPGYSPSAIAKEAILDTHCRDSWQHLVEDERERSAGVHQLVQHLAIPGSIWTALGMDPPLNYVEKMREDPVRAREFTRMLYEVHQTLANEVASLLDLRGARHMLDLGGNSGVVSMALLRRHPDLRSTVVDLETVCEAGREIAAEQGFSDRLSYYAADFMHDALPVGSELVLKCDVGVFAETLYARVWQSLEQGGWFVLVDYFSPTEEKLHPSRLRWSFLDSLHDPDFCIPTAAQVRGQLARTGFRVLPDEKRTSTGRVMIQAQK